METEEEEKQQEQEQEDAAAAGGKLIVSNVLNGPNSTKPVISAGLRRPVFKEATGETSENKD